MNIELKLSPSQQKIKNYFEPLYGGSLTDKEVVEISQNIRGFLVTLFHIQKEVENAKTERLQN